MSSPDDSECVSILHVSDFHCHKALNSRCLTPERHAAYSRSLRQALEREGMSRVDLIVATGDFVHQCDTSSFSFAGEVLTGLAATFEVDKRQVITCPGNHDYNRDYRTAGEFDDARAHYHAFATGFGCREQAAPRFDGAVVHKWDAALPVTALSLDANWGNPNGRPGNLGLTDRESHDIFTKLNGYLNENCSEHLVLLLGHYPISMQRLREDLPDRTATGLAPFYGLLCELNRALPVLSFCGDKHRAQRWDPLRSAAASDMSRPCMLDFLTGRFDSLSDDEFKGVPHHARVVRFYPASGIVEQSLFNFADHDVWDPRTINARWTKHEHEWCRTRAGDWQRGSPPKARGRKPPQAVRPSSPPRPTRRAAADDLADQIESKLADSSSVELRRMPVSPEYCRLVHIKLGPLMNDLDLMNSAVHRLAKWVRENGPLSQVGGRTKRSAEQVALIGIDTWGTWLAAEIGFRTDLRSFGITVRGSNDEEMDFELKQRGIVDQFRTSRFNQAVLVTDVIITGQTVNRVCRRVIELLKKPGEKPPKCDFWFASIIRAKSTPDLRKVREKLGTDQIELKNNGCSLLELSIPVVANDALPTPILIPEHSLGIS